MKGAHLKHQMFPVCKHSLIVENAVCARFSLNDVVILGHLPASTPEWTLLIKKKGKNNIYTDEDERQRLQKK